MRTLSVILLLMSNLCFAAKTDSAPQLLEQIKTSIAEAKCNGNNQCRTIAIGAKPCGGPETYLAWSVYNTDESKLKSLADQYAKARHQENIISQVSSDCAMVGNPGASCQVGHCGLLPSGLSNSNLLK